MAKIKMTKKRKLQALKYRQYIERQNTILYRELSKVFRDFGRDVETDLTKLNILAKINFKELEKRLSTVLKKRGKINIGNVIPFVKDLFGMEIDKNKLASVRNTSIEEYHRNVDKLIKNISDTTKSQIALVIEAGQKEGLNLNVIARNINDKFKDISSGRAKTIARTETSKAVNITTNNTAIEAKMEFKVWIHTGAGATDRPEHLALDGTKIKINEKFNVGGFDADYPHDPSLPASEVINCNCIAIYE
jgi:uncharacterized protein with gpF-like domain